MQRRVDPNGAPGALSPHPSRPTLQEAPARSRFKLVEQAGKGDRTVAAQAQSSSRSVAGRVLTGPKEGAPVAAVVVLGGGPAGLASAILLAEQGLEVVVLDRDGPHPVTRRRRGIAGRRRVSGSSASCTICSPAAGRSWTLREFYPAALVAFGEDLAHPDALAVLAKAPAPELGRRLSAAQAAAALRRAGRRARGRGPGQGDRPGAAHRAAEPARGALRGVRRRGQLDRHGASRDEPPARTPRGGARLTPCCPPGRRDRPQPARAWHHPRRPGARRVRR